MSQERSWRERLEQGFHCGLLECLPLEFPPGKVSATIEACAVVAKGERILGASGPTFVGNLLNSGRRGKGEPSVTQTLLGWGNLEAKRGENWSCTRCGEKEGMLWVVLCVWHGVGAVPIKV